MITRGKTVRYHGFASKLLAFGNRKLLRHTENKTRVFPIGIACFRVLDKRYFIVRMPTNIHFRPHVLAGVGHDVITLTDGPARGNRTKNQYKNNENRIKESF